MTLFRWSKNDVLTCAVVVVLWLGMVALMGPSSFQSFNGISGVMWAPTTWLTGVCAAAAAIRQARRRRAAARAVGATSPRRTAVLTLRVYGHDALVLALVPAVVAVAVVLGVGAFTALGGRLEWGYALVALLVCLVGVMIGEAVGIILDHAIIAPAVAFLVAVFVGLYGIYGSREIDTWSSFEWFAFTFLGVLLLVLLAGALLGTRRIPGRPDRLAAGAGVAVVVAFVLIIGPVPLSGGMREATEADSVCEPAGSHTLCLWREDEYKRPTLAAQIERLDAVAEAAGIDRSPGVYAEPGLMVGASEDTLSIIPHGGDKNSWPAAHFLAWYFMDDRDAECAGSDDHLLVRDLLANTLYGDLSYSGFATGSPEADLYRNALLDSLGAMSDAEAQDWMARQLRTHLDTCSLDLGEVA